MLKLILIFGGAGIGGVLRYVLGAAVQACGGPTFPVGTLVVNVSGCVAIGVCAALFDGPVTIRDEYRLAILVGVLGGYTTFSSFGAETMTLIADNAWWRASAYVVLTNTLGLLGVWAGTAATTRLCGRV